MGAFGVPDEHLIAAVLTIVACMVDAVGLIAPYWYYNDVGSVDVFFGIWEYCTSDPNTPCVDLPDIQKWQIAVQAMTSIGFILIALAMFTFFPSMFCYPNSDVMRFSLIGILVLAATSNTIAVIIYGTMASSEWIDNLHFAFAMPIIAAGICIISACFMCLPEE